MLHTRRVLLLLLVLLCAGRSAVSAQAIVANFSAVSTTGCPPAVIQFNDLSTGNPVSWLWNFGNSVMSTLQNPSTSYTAPGTYTVTLTVTNAAAVSNTKTITSYITIYPAPVVSFSTNSASGCPPFTTSFTQSVTLNAPGAGTYIWNFGDGNTLIGSNPSHTFINPGYYNVTLSAVNSAGCTTSVVQNSMIHVYTPPSIAFTASPVNICELGGSTTFNPQIGGTGPFSYSWDFGDGGQSTSSNPTHSYGNYGSYNVQLIVTDGNGCKDTLLKTGYIHVSTIVGDFNGPTVICEDQIASFSNNTQQTTTSCYWNFGDGGAASGNNTSHLYNTPGTYNVTMIVSNGICADTVVKQLIVHPKPVMAFTASPLQPCPAPAPIQFNNTSTGAANYTWNFGDFNTSTLTSPLHTYQVNGLFDVTLYATSVHGCIDSLKKIQYLKVYPLELSIKAVPPEGCIPVNIAFTSSAFYNVPISTSSIPYPYAITSYYWTFGDGGTSTLPTPNHTYTVYGTYPVTLTITTANGCTKTVMITIRAGTPPVANFGASPLSVCVNSNVYFIDSSSQNVTDWDWNFGDGGTSSNQNPTHSYSVPGTYTVKLRVSNNGCWDSLTRTAYILVNFPKASFNPIYSCDTPGKVNFMNTSINATSVLWQFGDGGTSTQLNPSHVYATAGLYNAVLHAYNSTTGCQDSMTVQVNILHLNTTIAASDSAFCSPDTISLFSYTTGGSPIQWDWIIDNTLIYDTTSTLAMVYGLAGGFHTIKVVITDEHNCRDTVVNTNFLLVGDPVANISAVPVNGCAPVNVVFTDASTYPTGTNGVSRVWTYGNGGPQTVTTPTITHPYPLPGQYDVSLVVTDQIGCKDSLMLLGYIKVQKPVADFSTSTTNACAGTPFVFFDASQGVQLTYSWSFGDGGTSTQANPTHIYQQTGTYTVKVVVTDDFGCKDSMIKVNYINVSPRPNAAFSMSDSFSICPPLIVNFTNLTTGGSQYQWSFGDGNTSLLANPSNIYTAGGLNVVRLIAINNVGCKDTAYDTVRILGYAGVLSYTPLAGCAPLTVQFTANNVSNVPAFIFDFSDGNTFATTATTVTHTYQNPGAYVPKIIMTDNLGCSASSFGLDTIKVDGVYAGFTYSPYPACDKGTLTFVDTSHGAYSSVTSRLWKFHSGSTSTSATPTQYYPGPGTYSVILYTSTGSGCRDTLETSVTFGEIPVIDAGMDTTICAGDTAILQPSGGVSYSWTPAASLVCPSCTNPGPHPYVRTVYTVTGKNAHGCANTDTVAVNIKTHTIGVFPVDTEMCAGSPIQLVAGGGTKYTWTPPAGLSDSHSSSPLASPAATTTYTIIIKEAGCIPDTGKVQVVVHPQPTVDAGQDQTIIAGNTASLLATGSSFITKYEWSPDTMLSCAKCAGTDATPPATTVYTIIATTDYGCKDTDQVMIIVVCEGSQLFIPNMFTPDGNGTNDRFYPHGKGISTVTSLRLYNRWGEVVFERKNMAVNDPDAGWDGKYKGEMMNPDVFVYILEAICSNGEKISWKGDVALIR